MTCFDPFPSSHSHPLEDDDDHNQAPRDMIRFLLLLANVTCGALARTIIVVGSGPGGSGFLERRLAEHQDTVLWFESGELRNDMATDWPVRLTHVDEFLARHLYSDR